MSRGWTEARWENGLGITDPRLDRDLNVDACRVETT
jgi:hypothetical protein